MTSNNDSDIQQWHYTYADEPLARMDGLLTKALAADVVLGNFPFAVSRAQVKKAILDQKCRVNGAIARDPSYRLSTGSRVELELTQPEDPSPQPENIPLDIVYEDDHLLVINKPAGLVVHPGGGTKAGTLVNALLHHCDGKLSRLDDKDRPGILHRLDKDTSGLLVAVKTEFAHEQLKLQFQPPKIDSPDFLSPEFLSQRPSSPNLSSQNLEAKRFASKSLGSSEVLNKGDGREFHREYIGYCWRMPVPRAGIIDKPLARDKTNRLRRVVSLGEDAREAITEYTTIESYHNSDKNDELAAKVSFRLQTGRTHQIRAHMASIGCPLLADEVYAQGFRSLMVKFDAGARAALQNLGTRQALHAWRIEFTHPVSRERLTFEAKLPQVFYDLEIALQQMTKRAR